MVSTSQSRYLLSGPTAKFHLVVNLVKHILNKQASSFSVFKIGECKTQTESAD